MKYILFILGLTLSFTIFAKDCTGQNTSTWSDCTGTMSFSNGDKYVGDYKNGKRSGKGVYYSFKGHKYEGEYENNKPNGQGIQTFANGERHEGLYKDGKLNGIGKRFYVSGSIYEGEFVEGKISGQGIYVSGVSTPFPGDRYVGSYKDGKKFNPKKS